MFRINLEKQTERNTYYRRVIYTDINQQLVLMCIPSGDDINREKHEHTTQFIRIESGKASVEIGEKKKTIGPGDCVMIPPNTIHYVKNTGSRPLKLYTIYSPPEHAPDTKQKKHIAP